MHTKWNLPANQPCPFPGITLPDGDILHSPSPSSEITSVSTPSVPSCTVSLASYSIPTITS